MPRFTFTPIIVRFFGLRFSLPFLDIVGDRGLRRMCLQFIRASYDFLLWLSSYVLSQNRTEIAGETTRAESEIVRTPHRHRTGSVQFPL